MKIAITGDTGFVGGHLARRLRTEGHRSAATATIHPRTNQCWAARARALRPARPEVLRGMRAFTRSPVPQLSRSVREVGILIRG
jgi:nucleoside-diphosphate-sugar epimerase